MAAVHLRKLCHCSVHKFDMASMDLGMSFMGLYEGVALSVGGTGWVCRHSQIHIWQM
jgi:hypothetical protein